MDLAHTQHREAWGGPFEYDLTATNWTPEEGPAGDAQAWAAPAAGHPLEYASIIDIFGSSCSLQPYVVHASSSCVGQQQLAECNYYNNYYAAAAQHHCPVEEEAIQEEQMETYMNNPNELFQEREKEFKSQAHPDILKIKMHRYPPRILDLDHCQLYTIPKVVAIGPYHKGEDNLEAAEKVKHMAAIQYMKEYRLDVRDLYQVVVSVAKEINARSLYDKDVMAGIGDEDEFLPMLFYDACFLVIYILRLAGERLATALYDFFESNEVDIAHDIMLLDNQIPWPVVDAVMNKNKCFDPSEKLQDFINDYKFGCLQDRVIAGLPVVLDKNYKAPHFLGLLRFYIVGKRSSSSKSKRAREDYEKIKQIQISPSAIELAEMGIFLTANETTDELSADMVLKSKWRIFSKLSMVPLSFNNLRASNLFNMAALELCTTPKFFDNTSKHEDSAVCSYLLLLCMLLHSKEDVRELRRKGILLGKGLTKNEALNFFNNFQRLPRGLFYIELMEQIQAYRAYRMTSWLWWLRLYKFVYKNRKIIAGILSVIGTVASIFGILKSAH